MKKIPLPNRGMEALVDDEDYESLSRFHWTAEKAGNSFRASRWIILDDGTRKRLMMHRVILGLTADQRCDHKDLNELNNQKANLRIATNSQNGANRRTWGRSRFNGVHWNPNCKNHWIARLRKDYKKIHLGCFATEEEAARAYDRAAKNIHGEFARFNFPQET